AGAVEVAGEDVEDVDQPGGERAVRDGAAADAAVDGGGGGGGELPGEGADGVRVDVAGRGGGPGGEVPQGVAEFAEAVQVGGEPARVGEPFLEEGVRHGREQQGVRAGADRDVPVG